MTLKSFDNPNSLDARQHLLDRRNERKHPKRHRTLGRRRRISALKKAKVKHLSAIATAERSRFLAKARAYWKGEADGHPIDP